jgi:acyl-CoA thioester hydrolase
LHQKNTHLRVRYAETDQMGVVYYGVYAQYFEVGRVESLRDLGIRYRALEEAGIMLPVRRLEVNYKAPARYDDWLTIETTVQEMPQTRILFVHRILNEEAQVLCTGTVELVFVDVQSRRPRLAPIEVINALRPYFNDESNE